MIKKRGCFCYLIVLPISMNPSVNYEDLIKKFLKTYTESYQDVFAQGRVILKGSNRCDIRYDLIQPILNLYKTKPFFSLLDIGAAEGYFSFRVASEYKNASCVMIDSYQQKNGLSSLAKILDIYKLNSDLQNVFFLNYHLTIKGIAQLATLEHFNIVLAFLVLHQMAAREPQRKEFVFKALQELFKLGDNVIIESSTDIAPDIITIIETFIKNPNHQYNCHYIGELPRLYNNIRAMGRFYWFSQKETQSTSPLKKSTYKLFNGAIGYE